MARPALAMVRTQEDGMRVEGSYHFAAPRERVYAMLLDPAALQRCIPGCEALQAVGDGRYEATLKLGVAAIRGTYKGHVQIGDEQPPERYRMGVEGRGGPGFVRGEATLTLSERDDGTEVRVEGEGQLGGPLAGVAQRLIGGIAKMMMNQFFGCIRKQLDTGGGEAG
jgi:carbon monoxide dehydrogenase subunit G